MCLLASWNIQPLAGGLVGQPLDLTAATASSSSSSLSPPPPPPPFRLLLFLLLFSAPCSEWQQQSQRGRGPLRRPRRGEGSSSNRWGSRNLPSHHSHSQLTDAPTLSLFFFLDRVTFSFSPPLISHIAQTEPCPKDHLTKTGKIPIFSVTL